MFRSKSIRHRARRGQATIIGLIVAMAIIVILAAWMYPMYLKPGGAGGPAASPEQDAEDVACGTYYQQIGDAIVEYKDQHGAPPPNLAALHSEGVTTDMYDDPACKFVYDPQTGMLGDKDVALPPAPPQTAGTPGAPASAAPGTAPQPASNAPNPNIYSKAQNAGSGEQVPTDLVGGGNSQ